MLKLPQNYIMDSECKDLLIKHVKEYIINYYHDSKLEKQGIDIRLGKDFLKVVYNKHHYFVTLVKISNVLHYYLKCVKKEPITLIVKSSKVFDIIIKLIIEHDKLLYSKESY